MRTSIVYLLWGISFTFAVLTIIGIGLPYTTTFASIYAIAYLVSLSLKDNGTYSKQEKISFAGACIILTFDLYRFLCFAGIV